MKLSAGANHQAWKDSEAARAARDKAANDRNAEPPPPLPGFVTHSGDAVEVVDTGSDAA